MHAITSLVECVRSKHLPAHVIDGRFVVFSLLPVYTPNVFVAYVPSNRSLAACEHAKRLLAGCVYIEHFRFMRKC